MKNAMRLDKLIASQTTLSRREARQRILSGRVSVNTEVCRSIDASVMPQQDTVLLDGQAIGYQPFVYYMLHKPAGVLSASRDRRATTVLDLLNEHDRTRPLFPVGRLDKNTTGLLLLTDDGMMAHRIISPKSGIEKEYSVTLDGPVTDDMVKRFAEGITLTDGTVCASAGLTALENCRARVILTEGKYHEIKRMFGVCGLGVNQLHRMRIGHLWLPDDLPVGEYRPISAKELSESVFC